MWSKDIQPPLVGVLFIQSDPYVIILSHHMIKSYVLSCYISCIALPISSLIKRTIQFMATLYHPDFIFPTYPINMIVYM